MIRAIHHLQLAMPHGREAAAEALCAGLLGVHRVSKPRHLERCGGCWFRSAAVEIHLGAADQFVPANTAHPAFLVDDLSGPPRSSDRGRRSSLIDEPLPGYDRFYTSDPVGSRIELLSPRR